MSIPILLRDALQSPRPAVALRDAIIALKGQGQTQSEFSEALNLLLLEVREQQTESSSEEATLDTLDLVTGWCQPSARLFPELVV